MAFNDFSYFDMTLVGCKKHNRYQRYEFWKTKTIDKLLRAIQQGYVPVGKALPRLKRGKKLGK